MCRTDIRKKGVFQNEDQHKSNPFSRLVLDSPIRNKRGGLGECSLIPLEFFH
jgi:hypothetical protein